MEPEVWELFAVVALSVLASLLLMGLAVGAYVLTQTLARWFTSGQWRKDLWR